MPASAPSKVRTSPPFRTAPPSLPSPPLNLALLLSLAPTLLIVRNLSPLAQPNVPAQRTRPTCGCTRAGPFNVPCNGFFASWISLFAALTLLNAAANDAPSEYLARASERLLGRGRAASQYNSSVDPDAPPDATAASSSSDGGSPASRRFTAYLAASSFVLLLASLHAVFGPLTHAGEPPLFNQNLQAGSPLFGLSYNNYSYDELIVESGNASGWGNWTDMNNLTALEDDVEEGLQAEYDDQARRQRRARRKRGLQTLASSGGGAAPGGAAPGGAAPGGAASGGTVYGASGASIWALMVSIISLKDCFLLLTMSEPTARRMAVSFLVLLWLLTAVATTIEGPFRAGGNGFFGVWMGLATSCFIALEEFERQLTATPHFVAACLYSSSTLVLMVCAGAYLAFPATTYYCPMPSSFNYYVKPCLSTDPGAVLGFPCGGAFSLERARILEAFGASFPSAALCPKGLSNFAFAYGLTGTLLGLALVALLIGRDNVSVLGMGPPPPSLVALGKRLLGEPAAATEEAASLPPRSSSSGLRPYGAMLLVYSLAAALALTYYFPPFSHLDNGFLAAWVGVAAAGLLLRDDKRLAAAAATEGGAVGGGAAGATQQTGGAAGSASDESSYGASAAGAQGGGRPLAMLPAAQLATLLPSKPPYAACLFVASLLLMIASGYRWNYAVFMGEHGNVAWAMACGIITLACLGGRALVTANATCATSEIGLLTRLMLALVLAICWLFAALVLTFFGPFTDVGNGYLATWGGMLCSWGLAFDEFTVRKLEMEALAAREAEALASLVGSPERSSGGAAAGAAERPAAERMAAGGGGEATIPTTRL